MRNGLMLIVLIICVAGVVGCALIRKAERAADAVTKLAQVGTVTLEQFSTNTVPMLTMWVWEIQQNQNLLITETRENAKKLTEAIKDFLKGLTGCAVALGLYFKYRTTQANKHVATAIKNERARNKNE